MFWIPAELLKIPKKCGLFPKETVSLHHLPVKATISIFLLFPDVSKIWVQMHIGLKNYIRCILSILMSDEKPKNLG